MRKGFTLVELLATITILGIILVAVVPAVNRWIGRSRTEQLESLKKTLVMAAKSYTEDNSDVLPKSIGENTKITAQLLRNKNYLKDDIVNSQKKSCMKDSYVRVNKNSKKSYKYFAYLYCEGDVVPKEDELPKPNIYIEFSDEKDSSNFSNNVNITTVKISIDGGEDNSGNLLDLDGYSYILSVKYSSDPLEEAVEIYNSGSLDVDGKKKVDIKRNLSDYVDITKANSFEAKVTAYNTEGGYAEREVNSKYEDMDKPICGDVQGEAGENEWNNAWRKKTITVKCSDGDGSGCVKDSFTHTFDTEMEIGYIKISDNAGNTTDCPVRVHLDWTTPTVTINAYKRNSNGTAGEEVGSISANNSNRNVILNNYTGGYGDNSWLNAANFPHGIYYEVITTDNVILNKGTWYENARGLWLPNNQIDTLVEKSSKTYTPSDNKAYFSVVDEGFRKARFVFNDKALNTITIDITSPIDRTYPRATASKSHLDTEDGVTVTVNCTDSGSGCQRAQDIYYGVKNTQSYYVYDNAGNRNSDSNAPIVIVNRYDCHPFKFECGSYVCGVSYYCASGGSLGGMGGCVKLGRRYQYCPIYCTGWNSCYN